MRRNYNEDVSNNGARFAMKHVVRILRAILFYFSATAVWLLLATQAVAQPSSPTPKAEEGITDYTLSYMVVVLGIVLGLLVVAKTSNRRDRERPAGYVEKNIMADE
jgi:hypothetical protein